MKLRRPALLLMHESSHRPTFLSEAEPFPVHEDRKRGRAGQILSTSCGVEVLSAGEPQGLRALL